MYLPFRASWQTVIRPCTSFPPPPLKFRTVGFPQYGFKQARAAATFVRGEPLTYTRPRWASFVTAFDSVVGFRQTAPPQSIPTTCPVALGSRSGCVVRPDHRLLWPHPRLWSSLAAYVFFRSVGHLPKLQRFPNLLCESFPSCHPQYPDGPNGCFELVLRRQCCLRPIRKGSASAAPTHVEFTWVV